MGRGIQLSLLGVPIPIIYCSRSFGIEAAPARGRAELCNYPTCDTASSLEKLLRRTIEAQPYSDTVR